MRAASWSFTSARSQSFTGWRRARRWPRTTPRSRYDRTALFWILIRTAQLLTQDCLLHGAISNVAAILINNRVALLPCQVAENYLAWCPRSGEFALRHLFRRTGGPQLRLPAALRGIVGKLDVKESVEGASR